MALMRRSSTDTLGHESLERLLNVCLAIFRVFVKAKHRNDGEILPAIDGVVQQIS
jgi:hypothetical protein